MLKAGACINARKTSGHTALYTAAYAGTKAVVETLSRAGANVEAKCNEGRTGCIAARMLRLHKFYSNLAPTLRRWTTDIRQPRITLPKEDVHSSLEHSSMLGLIKRHVITSSSLHYAAVLGMGREVSSKNC